MPHIVFYSSLWVNVSIIYLLSEYGAKYLLFMPLKYAFCTPNGQNNNFCLFGLGSSAPGYKKEKSTFLYVPFSLVKVKEVLYKYQFNPTDFKLIFISFCFLLVFNFGYNIINNI